MDPPWQQGGTEPADNLAPLKPASAMAPGKGTQLASLQDGGRGRYHIWTLLCISAAHMMRGACTLGGGRGNIGEEGVSTHLAAAGGSRGWEPQ